MGNPQTTHGLRLLALALLFFIAPRSASAEIHCDYQRIGTRNINRGPFGFPNLIDVNQERLYGAVMDERLRRRLLSSASETARRYVERLALRIASKSDLQGDVRIHLATNQEHLAFATMGGFLYLDEELLRVSRNESELAGVIAHEIGHLAARHSAENHSRSAAIEGNPNMIASLLQPLVALTGQIPAGGETAFWSTVHLSNEIEADELATQYLWNAGFDPEGLLNALRMLKDRNFLDLPSEVRNGGVRGQLPTRIRHLEKTVKRLPALENAQVDSSGFVESRSHVMTSARALSSK